jgi:hypothetical protein
MFDIFEQPWTLLIVAILVLLVMLMLRRIFPVKRHWAQWLLPAFLTVAAFGFDLLVKTNLEKINAVINTAVKAVEEENCHAIAAIISDNYHDSYHNTKKDLMRHCRARLSEPLVAKNKKRPPIIEISSPKATVTLTIIIHFDKQSYVYQDIRLMWAKVKLDLQKEQNGSWLINRVEILEIDGYPANWRRIRRSS